MEDPLSESEIVEEKAEDKGQNQPENETLERLAEKGFVPCSSSDFTHKKEDDNDKELWLVQVPKGVSKF